MVFLLRDPKSPSLVEENGYIRMIFLMLLTAKSFTFGVLFALRGRGLCASGEEGRGAAWGRTLGMGNRLGKKEGTDKKDTIKKKEEEREEESKWSIYSDLESHLSSDPKLNSKPLIHWHFVFAALVGRLGCATWYWCWVRSLMDEAEQGQLYSLQ